MPSIPTRSALPMARSALTTKLLALLGSVLLFGLLPPAASAVDAMPGMAKAKAPRLELGASAAFSPDGTLLVAAKQGDHVMIYRSADEGKTWSTPAAVNAQPEAISADGENRPKIDFAADGGLLVSWTHPFPKPNTGAIRLARADDGQHFSPPLTVHKDTAEITHRFESMLVLPDNKVMLIWKPPKTAKHRIAALPFMPLSQTMARGLFSRNTSWPTIPANVAG